MKHYKYTFRSPLNGSIQCDDLFREDGGVKELDSQDMARLYDADPDLSSFLEANKADLAEHLPDDLKKMVYKLEVGDYGCFAGRLCLLSYAWSTKELTGEEVQDILDYLSGQFSDGWGEGLEQREWRVDPVRIPTIGFDIYAGDWEEDYESTRAFFYVHPWVSHSFCIDFTDREIEEVEDPESDIDEELRQTLLKIKDLVDQIVEELKDVT